MDRQRATLRRHRCVWIRNAHDKAARRPGGFLIGRLATAECQRSHIQLLSQTEIPIIPNGNSDRTNFKMSRDAHRVRHVLSTHGSRAGHTIEQPTGCRATKTCARDRPFFATSRKWRVAAPNSAASPTTEAMSPSGMPKERILTPSRSPRRRAFEGRQQQVYRRSPDSGRSGS